ncbi:MAG: class I SAM-dependent methyltransferase [Lactobacillus sp.]|jgi:SAM-dependent methyltransferase|nr:class I SAM-dependent methyltransferase [Lactobacillus sp.]
METFALVFNIIVAILVVAFTIYIWTCLLISKGGKRPPFIPSIGKEKKIIIEKASEYITKSKKKMKIMDPGCGSGSLLLPLAEKFGKHNFVGIDLGIIPYNLIKKKSEHLKNVEVYNDDMFKHSFKDVDLIVCFFTSQFAPMFSEKVLKDAKKGCVIISNSTELPNLKLIEKIPFRSWFFKSYVYVYRI